MRSAGRVAGIGGIGLAWLVLLSSCGDSRLTTSGDDDEGAPSLRERPAYDPNRDTPDGTGDGPTAGRCCVLVPASGSTTLSVGFDGTADLGVYLFSLATGDPMGDEAIGFALAGDTSGGAALSAANSFTDANGLAQIRVSGGSVPSELSLTASHEGANDVVFTVQVLDLPVGAINVTVNHPSASLYDVSPINVRLFPRSQLRCELLDPGMYPADFFVQADLENTSQQALFENLLADETFTVVATGFGALGEIAAQGCVDEVFVQQDQTREVEVVLQLLPMNPVGDYDVEAWWDYSAALAETGSVGAIILDILDLFENPGQQLIEYVLDAVEYFVGGLVSAVIEVFLDATGLDDLLAGFINDLINSSDTLRNFFSIGCDLRRMVTRLQVLSVLTIGKIGSDFEIFGADTWVGLGLCDFTPDEDFVVGTCDESPDCERIPVIVDGDELGLLRGDWNGRVMSYNNLVIDRHAIDFNYGRLILFVLENWIFPALTGDDAPVTLEDVVHQIIDCEAVGDGIGDICAFGECIEASDIAGFCDTAVSLVFGTFFRTFVDALSFDSIIEVRGDARLVNSDTDLDVESLEDGQYTGTITVNGNATSIDATFVGQRRGE